MQNTRYLSKPPSTSLGSDDPHGNSLTIPHLAHHTFHRLNDHQLKFCATTAGVSAMPDGATEAAPEAETRQRAKQVEGRLERYRKQADGLYDVLQDHSQALSALNDDLHNAMERLEEEARQGSYQRYIYDTFVQQLSNACIISEDPVRTYAIASWTNAVLPKYLEKAVTNLVHHHGRTARLKFRMHEAEVKSNLERHDEEALQHLHEDCPEGAFCKRPHEMFARHRSLRTLGDENDSWSNGFCDYSYQVACRSDLGHLRASFEVRKTWLALSPSTMRYGFSGIEGAAWNDSLDEKMKMFVECTLRRLTPEAIEEAMLMEIEKAGIVGGRKLIWEAASRLAKETEGLATEMQDYADDLVKRSDDIHSTYDDLAQAQRSIDAHGGITSHDDAAELLGLEVKFRGNLADGVHIQPHLLNHAYEKLVQVAHDWFDAKERDERDRQLSEQQPQPALGVTWGNLSFGNVSTHENVPHREVVPISYEHLPAMHSQHDIEGGHHNADLTTFTHLGDDGDDYGSSEGEAGSSQHFYFEDSEDEWDDQEDSSLQEAESQDVDNGEYVETIEDDREYDSEGE